ncbi:MAG: methylmalonyl-CoA mutase family protein [Kiritimatiellae bacterium]|nr:methylmalonyl-CoA mutase family protein [Kiritimatiellia bacterium]
MSIKDKTVYEASKKGWEEAFSKKDTAIDGVLYTPEDVENQDYTRDQGFPGEYPYTRGVRANMYHGRLWTMRQFSGFGSARESNERNKFLLSKGQTGLSVAFDTPTIMGRDSDHPLALGEVGRCGVAIDSIRDMEVLFDGVPLDKISTSMTINAPAAILLAMYVVVAERQGVSLDKLTGTLQNDILKEYHAQNTWIYPPAPSLRIITDIMGFCLENIPRWNTISISGYHIREAGSTAVQELAFTLADGFAYVEAGIEAGLDVDSFAPRLSFFFNSHSDFFEEIAKFRAARRIWARHMKEKYGAKDPRSLLMRFHTQTAGCSLTAQQPENNIVRTAFQGLAAVLGGTQSLHTNSMDEALSLPTEKAVEIALRTQQITACETGVPDVIDPLGGSYYVESLTDKMEEGAEEYFAKIEECGGMLEAVNRGFFRREIEHAAFEFQKELDSKQRIIVGVNDYISEEEVTIDTLRVDPAIEDEQKKNLAAFKKERDNVAVADALDRLKKDAEGTTNLMPGILDVVRKGATEGEICDVFRGVFGEFLESDMG